MSTTRWTFKVTEEQIWNHQTHQMRVFIRVYVSQCGHLAEAFMQS